MASPERRKFRFVSVFAIVVGTGIILAILVAGLGVGWFFFYSADLPDINALARYAPAEESRVSDPCLGESTAIPYDTMGGNLRAALDAAEGNGGDERQRRTTMSVEISRSMFCMPSRQWSRQLKEARVAGQIERRFSLSERLAIFANRAQFGENLVGVESSSRYFFRKAPNELGIGEAALLAGLMRQPSYYSPERHPDRALRRRNAVIDRMVGEHAISVEQAEAAKALPVAVAAK